MDNRVHNIGFFDFAVVEEKLWFCNVFSGDIVSLDMKKNTFSCEEFLKETGKMQYGKVELVNNKLYFLPRNATQILIYDTKKRLVCIKNLRKRDDRFEKPLFIDMCKIDNKLILIPGRYPWFVEVDTCDDNVKYYYIDELNRENGLLTNCSAVLFENEVIVYKNSGDALLVFNTLTKKQKLITIETGIKSLSAVKINGNIIYAGFSHRIAVFNTICKKVSWIEYYDDCERPIEGLGQLLTYEGYIFAIALNQPIIYTVSIETCSIKKWIEFQWGDGKKSVWDCFTKCDVIGAKILNDTIILYSTMRNEIIEINIPSKEITYHDFFMWDKENKEFFVSNFLKEQAIDEGVISLNDFTNCLSKS